MKKTFLRIAAIVTMVLSLGTWIMVPELNASGARDCDGNAIIYCGALTKSELASKINHGTSGSHQSASQLKDLFGHYGIKTSDFDELKDGRVTDDNKVYVGSKVVASNVYSMGRHDMPGSSRVSGFSYPIYLRHPSVSFRSHSIDAFVKLNEDGSMRYAVIKSCGNIVPGKKPSIPTFNLEVRKWNDLDRDGRIESGEPYLPNWKFKVTGNGINQTVTTRSNGSVFLKDLKKGTYTVTEVHQSGWTPTTSDRKTVNLDRSQTVFFGNARIPAATIRLQVIKFNDQNGDKNQDGEEERLSGWSFRITGNGQTQTVVTDANGQVEVPNLAPGNYTVTEINQAGWENTTGLTISRNVTTDPSTQVFIFGNRKVTEEQPPGGGEQLPVSGPAETAAAAGASFTLTGSVLAYIRSKKNFLKSLIK